MAQSYRIITRYAEFTKATVIGRSGADLHLAFWGVRESRAGRCGNVPWNGGQPVLVREWVRGGDVVKMIPME